MERQHDTSQQGGLKLPIPRLPSVPQKKFKQFKSTSDKIEEKRMRDRSRIYIGESIFRWRELRELKGFKHDEELAKFLMDSYQSNSEAPTSILKKQPLTAPTALPALSKIQEDITSSITFSWFPEAIDEEEYNQKEKSIFDSIKDKTVSQSNNLRDGVTSEDENEMETDEIDQRVDDEYVPPYYAARWTPSSSLASTRTSTLRARVKLEDENEFGNSPQSSSLQQFESKRHSETQSFYNQEDVKDAESVASDHTLCLVKEQSIKMERDGDFSNQEEANNNDPSSMTPVLSKDPEEELVSDYESEENSDGDSVEDTNWPNHIDRPKKYYTSVRQLCDDCGCFYNPQKGHTCEYKLKPFSCNLCGKRLRTKVALKSHSHIHDNSKTHNCKYCYASFKTKLDKFKHQETHKDELSPFKCHSCPAAFDSFVDRKKHLTTHPRAREHKCEMCGISFQIKHVLLRHMVIHSGEKAFKCPVCDRGFNQQGHLKSHLRLHTGEKPYNCQYCDKAFNHNVSLKSHVQRYHPNDRPPETEGTRGNESADSGGDRMNNQPPAEDANKPEVETDNSERWSSGRPKGRPKRNLEEKKSKRSLNESVQKTQRSPTQSEEEIVTFDLN